jgi:hypothetical protein
MAGIYELDAANRNPPRFAGAGADGTQSPLSGEYLPRPPEDE